MKTLRRPHDRFNVLIENTSTHTYIPKSFQLPT